MPDQLPSAADPQQPLSRWKSLRKRIFDRLGLVLAVAFYFLAYVGVHAVDPTAGGFDLGLVQAFALPPLLFFLNIFTAVWTYKYFLPRQFAYLMSCVEGKVLERVLPEEKELFTLPWRLIDQLFAESKMRYHQLQFTIRCVRFLLALLPLFFFLWLLLQLTQVALGVVPQSV